MTRILIADSQHILRRGLRGLLETRSGWTVVAEAEDGYGAIDAAMRTLPDVAILDSALPGMNGLETARRIHQQLVKTDLCMFSYSAEESSVLNALDFGIRGFILKSDAEEDLLAAVETISRHHPYVSCAITHAAAGSCMTHARKPSKLATLTPREREVVQLVAEGLSNKQIGRKLALSIKTVECHRGAAMRKAGWSSMADLIRYAVRNHLVQA